MYDYFRGKAVELTPASIVIEVGGIGYMMMISLRSFEAFSSKEDVLAYAHQYLIRDDLPVLYGFSTKDEREIFRLLVSVSGVGGNTARTILSTFNSAELQQIISTGDSAMLKKVKGLGQKTAEKVIVELRDKIITVDVASSGGGFGGAMRSSEVFSEALTALTLLGFKRDISQKSIRDILSKEPNLSVEDVIKRALKSM